MSKKILCLCAALFTTCGLAMRNAIDVAPVRLMQDGGIWVLALCALYLLYQAVLKLAEPFRPIRIWFSSAFFAGVMTLGRSFALEGSTAWVGAHKFKAFLYFAACLLICFALTKLILEKLSKAGETGSKTIHPALTAGALLLCWTPWYFCIYPGTVSNDSISQMMMLFGIKPFTAANPVAQTGLAALMIRIGQTAGKPDLGVAAYCLIQAGFMAILLAALIAEMNRSSASAEFTLLTFAFYAFCPVFPVFAFCVGKDTNFAMAVLWLALNVWRLLAGKCGVRNLIRYTLSAILCVLLRNAGILLAIGTTAIVVIRILVCERKNSRSLIGSICAFAAAAVAALMLQFIILPGIHADPMPESENYSMPLQQVTRIALANGLTEAEQEIINQVLPLDEAKQLYNGELSDRVKDLWKAEAPKESKAAFWKLWPRLVIKHPGTCFSALFHNSYGYLCPGYLSTIKPTLIIAKQTTDTATVEGYFDFSVNPRAQWLKDKLNQLAQNPLYRILISPGIYGWIVIIAMLVLIKKPHLLIPALPAAATLFGCILSPVNGYFRYAMPLYLSAPFLLWLIFLGFRDNERNSRKHQPAEQI